MTLTDRFLDGLTTLFTELCDSFYFFLVLVIFSPFAGTFFWFTCLIDNHHIKELIGELRSLRIRETEGLNAIDKAIPAMYPPANQGLSTAVSIDTSAAASGTDSMVQDTFLVGDRVCTRVEITNKVRRLFNRTPTNKDRSLTVIKVSEKRIDLITDNGTETWTAPHNLRRIMKNV
jgi:hypothetical protein